HGRRFLTRIEFWNRASFSPRCEEPSASVACGAMKTIWSWISIIICFAALALSACGHTDEEMAAKQREIDKLSADLKAARQQMADDQQKFSDAQNQIERMKEQLKQAGLGLEKSKEDAARL